MSINSLEGTLWQWTILLACGYLAQGEAVTWVEQSLNRADDRPIHSKAPAPLSQHLLGDPLLDDTLDLLCYGRELGFLPCRSNLDVISVIHLLF